MSTRCQSSHWLLKLGIFTAAVLLCASIARAQAPMQPGARARASASHVVGRTLMRRDLVGLPGKEVVMSTVEFPPGASSPPHRHDAQVFVYMLQGRMIMQVKGGPRVTIGPGQMFYENPTDIHLVSANASKTRAAKFLALVIKDKDKPGLIPVSPEEAGAPMASSAQQSSAQDDQASMPPAAKAGSPQLMKRDVVGLPGKEVVVSVVRSAPGHHSPPHRHNAQVFVYMLQGRMIMQVKGGPRMTIGPGQTFYEKPTDIHLVSANASKTRPAKFLAFLIKDKGAPGTIPVAPDPAR